MRAGVQRKRGGEVRPRGISGHDHARGVAAHSSGFADEPRVDVGDIVERRRVRMLRRHPIVRRDDDRRVVPRQPAGDVRRVEVGADGEPATVRVQDHRQDRIRNRRLRPVHLRADVTVAHRQIDGRLVDVGHRLLTGGRDERRVGLQPVRADVPRADGKDHHVAQRDRLAIVRDDPVRRHRRIIRIDVAQAVDLTHDGDIVRPLRKLQQRGVDHAVPLRRPEPIATDVA